MTKTSYIYRFNVEVEIQSELMSEALSQLKKALEGNLGGGKCIGFSPLPSAPKQWEVGMVVKYVNDHHWAWKKGQLGRVVEIRRGMFEGDAQTFISSPYVQEGEKVLRMLTNPDQVAYTGKTE